MSRGVNSFDLTDIDMKLYNTFKLIYQLRERGFSHRLRPKLSRVESSFFMGNYFYTKKFRGNPVSFQGNRGMITIRNSQLQRGTRPTVGLSDALLNYIDKFHITLYVTVLAPEVSFKTTAKEWKKTSKKEEQASYYNEPWYIYRGPIPEEAFKKQEEKKVLVEMTEDERERYKFYKQQQQNFYGK